MLATPQRRLVAAAGRALAALLAALLNPAAWPAAARADELIATLQGPPSVVFDPAGGCSGVDVPDTPARAYRDGAGRAVMFALHDVAHPLRGPDLEHLAIDCRSALDSPSDPDPSHYADRLFVAATWTRDGVDVAALVHAEYHADQHGRCAAGGDIACWWNAILAFRSRDGGAAFRRMAQPVVAAAPFTQDHGQGRHRGFFEPSNMVGDGGHVFAFLSTTGWDGQEAGSCLFRTDDPLRPSGWRAYDGHDFTVRYLDPYRPDPTRSRRSPRPCAVIPPFRFAVNAVVRHAQSGLWLAVLQASPMAEFPVDGFYTASSRDLLHWSRPRLLLAGRTLYSDWCRANGGPAAAGAAGVDLMNYPSILDPSAPSRNFDAVGATPFLYYAAMATSGCATARRLLVRRPLSITLRRDGEAQR